jgi:hypothetical protein
MARASTGITPGFSTTPTTSGFVIKLCRPYRAKTKGKVERFNGYLRRSFYVPLASRLKQAGLQLDVVTANMAVSSWLADVANERVHGTTGVQPSARLKQERPCLQTLPAPWRADIAAARPQAPVKAACSNMDLVQPAAVAHHMAQVAPMQHPLAVYEQLLIQITQGAVA